MWEIVWHNRTHISATKCEKTFLENLALITSFASFSFQSLCVFNKHILLVYLIVYQRNKLYVSKRLLRQGEERARVTCLYIYLTSNINQIFDIEWIWVQIDFVLGNLIHMKFSYETTLPPVATTTLTISSYPINRNVNK